MSKKNKNNWDLTLDEQSETLDLFARMQTDPEACNTILGLHKIKDAPEELGETGLPVSLEKNIINDMEKYRIRINITVISISIQVLMVIIKDHGKNSC